MTKVFNKRNAKRVTAILLAVVAVVSSIFIIPTASAAGKEVTVTFDYCYDTGGNIISFVKYTEHGGYTVGTVGEELCRIYADGKDAYCIEPGHSLYSGNTLTTDASAAWNALSKAQKKAVNLALLFGKSGSSSSLVGTDGQKWIATQLVACGSSSKQDVVTGVQSDTETKTAYFAVKTSAGSLKIVKTSDDGKVDGVKFKITGADNYTKEYVCGDNWTIREIEPSEGYQLDKTVYPVGAEAKKYTIEHNKCVLSVNEDVIKGDIEIVKHTDQGQTKIETPEEGATFQLFLKSAGSFDNAHESVRDTLVCDEKGYSKSKKGVLKMAELTYTMQGDYLLPNLTLPEQPKVELGQYAQMRRKYLYRQRRILYTNLLTKGKLTEHLAEIEQTALEMEERLLKQMAAQEGVTEKLKAENTMKWTRLMNNLRHSAQEIVQAELIYA